MNSQWIKEVKPLLDFKAGRTCLVFFDYYNSGEIGKQIRLLYRSKYKKVKLKFASATPYSKTTQ